MVCNHHPAAVWGGIENTAVAEWRACRPGSRCSRSLSAVLQVIEPFRSSGHLRDSRSYDVSKVANVDLITRRARTPVPPPPRWRSFDGDDTSLSHRRIEDHRRGARGEERPPPLLVRSHVSLVASRAAPTPHAPCTRTVSHLEIAVDRRRSPRGGRGGERLELGGLAARDLRAVLAERLELVDELVEDVERPLGHEQRLRARFGDRGERTGRGRVGRRAQGRGGW